MDDCIISEIINDPSEPSPVIVKFQNANLRDGKENALQCNIFKNYNNKTIATLATNNIFYLGEVHKNDDLFKNFLLIRNKKTNKVKLVAVDQAIVSPQLKQSEADLNISSEVNKTAISNLNKEFGSKKAKRVTEQRERMQMDVDNVKDQLEQTVANITINERDLNVTPKDNNDSLYKPSINREASIKEEVYILEDIVPIKILNSLKKEASEVLQSDLDELNLSPYIKENLLTLKESTKSDVIKKCELLLFVNYLMNFVQKPARLLTKKFVLCQSSPDVNNHILENFSVSSGTGRTRPLTMKDKSICYILVLLMIALDYQIDMEKISRDIKLGLKKILDMGRILAFSSLGSNKNVMILKLPLPPPKILMSQRKRK